MFPETTSAVLNALAEASVRALLVVGIAVAAAWRRPAAFRHAVFAGALCVMLLLPPATALLPQLPLTVLPAGPALTDVGVVTAGTPAALSPAKVEQASSSVTSWPAFAVILWCAMAAAFGLRVISGIYMARRAVRGASPVWDDRFGSLPSGCGVYESDVARVPLTVGSSIILPAGWHKWDDARLAAVLAHEGAHVRRRDWLLTVLAALNRCVFWFHPLAWWLERRIAVDAEHAADDASLIATGDRRAYAELLLEMARNAAGGRMGWQGLAMARPSGVSRRIDAALDDRRKRSAGLSRASAVAVVVAGVALLVVAGTARLVAQEPATVRGGSNPVFFMGAGPNILDADTAAGVEQELLANPEDTNARLRLITYYNSRNRDTGRLTTHVLWFVEHQPEARFNPAFAMLLFHAPDISPLQIQEFLAKWDAAVAAHPEHSGVLINAAEVLCARGASLRRSSSGRWRHRRPSGRGHALC
jgi:NADH:ubiquinone oxidoreductase subunit